MAIVTGDRYLTTLHHFLTHNTTPLLDQTLTLKLNPAGLHYIATRLDALRELETLTATAPVDYLRAYVADLGDHRALEQLRRILALVPALKVFSVIPGPERDPTPVSVGYFKGLRVLELRGCDLSTAEARGLGELRETLEKLICHNSTDALRHVFASRIVDIKQSPVWTRLRYVSCACNGLEFMDESLQLLPVVETLDLSRNRFSKVDNLQKCRKLKNLDLEFNHLRTIACLSEVSCPLVKLVLRNNALTKLRGLENMKSVKGLDLSNNIISSFSDLEVLANLPALESLLLEGNPICCARWYRAHVFSFFSDPEKLTLDEKGITTREHWERFIIFAKRQERPTGYGFYFPAKGEAVDEGSTNKKKKKHSRLASIDDDDKRRSFGSTVEAKEPLSCDSEIWRKDEFAIYGGDSVRERVENMKKEFSVLWLREFKEWLEQNSEGTNPINGSECIGFSLRPLEEKVADRSNGRKHLAERTPNVLDMPQVSENRSHTNILESGISFPDTSAGVHQDEYKNGKDHPKLPVLSGGEVRVENFEQGHLKVHSSARQKNPLSKVNSQSDDILTCEGSGLVVPKISLAPLTTIEEIIGSKVSSSPRSPPHFERDVLHRRLYLEEEFLNLSASSLPLASSDSDTSCSDDDTCTSNASNTEADCMLIEDSTKLSTSDASPCKVNHYEENGVISLSGKKICSPDHCARSHYIPPVQIKLVTDDDVDDHNWYEDDPAVSNTKSLKGKSKHIGRISSTMETSVNSKEAETRTSTGKLETSLVETESGYQKHSRDDIIRDMFNAEVADSKASETCEELVKCGCIYQQGSEYQEREVVLLRSSRSSLCMLVFGAESDGQGVIFRVLGSHSLEDVKEVVVGLGSQALRLCMKDSVTYLFLPRTVQKFNDLLCLLQVRSPTALGSGPSVQSWELVQVELLEKCLCRRLKMGIFLYSMLLLCHDRGDLWLRRSLFVAEGYLFVCCENVAEFGLSPNHFESSASYYSLDSCCLIRDVSEMITELHDTRCLSLTMNRITYGKKSYMNMIEKRRRPTDKKKQSFSWKLKWFSDDAMQKFISLLKAMYFGRTSSPLPVKCIS